MVHAARITGLGLLALLFALGANFGTDLAYRVHALLLMVLAAAGFIWAIRTAPLSASPEPRPAPPTGPPATPAAPPPTS